MKRSGLIVRSALLIAILGGSWLCWAMPKGDDLPDGCKSLAEATGECACSVREGCDPVRPDALRLRRSDDLGTVVLEVNPVITGLVKIELVEPQSLVFPEGGRVLTLELSEGGMALQRTLRLQDPATPRVTARLTAFSDDETPWLSLDEELVLDATPRPASGAGRVPVVFELADGRKLVEYMSEAEVARRGLEAARPAEEPTGGGR